MNNKKLETVNDEMQEVSFDDLQVVFDDQKQRLTAFFEQHKVDVRSFDFSAARSFRRRRLFLYAVIAVACIVASVLWSLNLGRYDYDWAFHIFVIFIECVYIFLSFVFIVKIVTLYCRRIFYRGFGNKRFAYREGEPLVRYYVPVCVAATVAVFLVVNNNLYGAQPDAAATQRLINILSSI